MQLGHTYPTFVESLALEMLSVLGRESESFDATFDAMSSLAVEYARFDSLTVWQALAFERMLSNGNHFFRADMVFKAILYTENLGKQSIVYDWVHRIAQPTIGKGHSIASIQCFFPMANN